jgi:hypothetical protein
MLVSFRGTESIGDWITNTNFFSIEKNYGAVHEGFYNGFAEVKDTIEKEFDRRLPKLILLTGHSLGGALATVAAAEWNGKYNISGVYTFGQPSVGNGTFSTFFSTNYSNKFFRFVNDDDIVTRLPLSYQHVGKLFHFDANSGLKSQTEAMSGKANNVEPKMMSETDFEDFRAQLLARRAVLDSTVITESLTEPVLEGFLPSISDHNLSEYIKKINTKVS